MIQITRVFVWIDFPSGDCQVLMNSFHHWFQHVNISYLWQERWIFRDIGRWSRRELKYGPFIQCCLFIQSPVPGRASFGPLRHLCLITRYA